jgi:flagellar transcriptional activator FlhC
MIAKSVWNDSMQINRAVSLIQLGARLQVLECETNLSYERLLRLYKEVAGRSPSKGQLPFSPDWFLTWQPNIHASLFLNIYEYLTKATILDDIDAVMKAYRLYAEQVEVNNVEPLLSITRAWRMMKFIDTGELTTTRCCRCSGNFVTDLFEDAYKYSCGLCVPPRRAGKPTQAGGIVVH